MSSASDSNKNDETSNNNDKSKKKKQATSSVEEVEETVSRISSHKGVLGVMIISEKGNIIHSANNGENNLMERASIILKVKQYAHGFFSTKSEDSHDNNDEHDDEDDLSFIRIRTQRQELLIAPNNDYLLVVLHNPLISTIDNSL
mmetsp:Transcript_8066/g.12627  ORF Transcript_8066/g.12627 Transcript_8066/m.12627 type:complete len:145 (+) Transcript_8066:35-469(+)